MLLHYRLMALFIAENIKTAISSSVLELIQTDNLVEIYYGGYMDEMILIDTIIMSHRK